MSANIKIAPLAVALLLGISLTLASFAYQRMGPARASYGNAGCETQPETCTNGQMLGDLLGAGFPLQYVVDNVSTSVWYSLGIEDDFKFLPFLLDLLFYTLPVYGVIKFTQAIGQRAK